MNTDLGVFGNDPWWIVVIKAIAIFVVLVLVTLLTIWWERRVVGRMQRHRQRNWAIQPQTVNHRHHARCTDGDASARQAVGVVMQHGS